MRGVTTDLAMTRANVQQYYVETAPDYAEFWTGSVDCALHFGYDDGAAPSHESSLLRTNAYLASLVPDIYGAAVLDAGCGVAGSAMWLASEFRCNVTGINVCMEQLVDASRYVLARNLERAVFLTAQDYHQIAMRDEAFQVVWALESTNHSPSRAVMFREFRRVLRHGGHLLLAELTISEAHTTQPPPKVDTLLRTFRQGWKLYGVETTQMLVDGVTAAGFCILQVQDATAAMAPSIARLGGFAVAAAQRIEERLASGAWTARRVENIRAAAALHELLALGVIRYTIIAATKQMKD